MLNLPLLGSPIYPFLFETSVGWEALQIHQQGMDSGAELII